MTDDRNAKSYGQAVLRTGRWITRGSERGTWTIAVPFGRPKASVPSSVTRKFRLLLRSLGKRVRGIKTDRTQQRQQFSRKKRRIQRMCDGIQSTRLRNRNAFVGKLRNQRVIQHMVLFVNELMSQHGDAAPVVPDGVRPSAPRCSAPCVTCSESSHALRKNSSRLELTIQRYFSRSNKGTF